MKTLKKHIASNCHCGRDSMNNAWQSLNRKKRFIPFTVIFACYGILLISISSCKKFLDIPTPSSQLVTPSVFNNNATATSAVTVLYAKMWSNNESYGMASSTGLLGDELTGYATSGVGFQEYTNSMIATGSYGVWRNSGAYFYIYQANAIISALQTTAGCSPAVKQQLTGEAYFVRAFWHLYLSNEYGDVPIALTTDYTVTDQLARSPRVQVLQQVIADLKTAQSLLNANYVDGSDTLTTTERVRPTQAVATALLARAYLYLGNYNNDASQYPLAEAAATTVINNSAYSLSPLTGSTEVFAKNSSEAIWQLQTPLPANQDTGDGFGFILVAAPNSGQVTISPQLLNTFEPNDKRKLNWLSSITAGGSTYYFPFKYKNRTYVGTEYTMVLRLAEQYLIRAEAETEEGKTSAAVADLNMIRTRAGLPNYAGLTDQPSLLTALFHERQVELFTEWGNRWFDLQRAKTIDAVMNIVAPTKINANWSSYKQLMPVPQTERNADVNLIQNTGY